MILIENALISLAGAGLGVSAGTAAASLLKRVRGLRMSTVMRQSKRTERIPLAVQKFLAPYKSTEDLPVWMQRWLAQTVHNLERTGSKLSPVRYAALIIFGALAGFVIGITLLQNLPASCLIAASAYLIPDQIINGRLQARKFKKIEQLGAAIRVFAAEFADTPQVSRAIAAVAKRAPDPLGAVFREAERLVVTGKSPDEVCAYLLKELDFEYGRMFVQVLRVAWNDASAKSLFSRLAARIGGMQSLIQKNRSGLAYSRIMAIIVNAMILPAALGIRFLIPETGYFLVHHPAGRLLVCMAFLSVLAGLILDKMLNEVEG